MERFGIDGMLVSIAGFFRRIERSHYLCCAFFCQHLAVNDELWGMREVGLIKNGLRVF